METGTEQRCTPWVRRSRMAQGVTALLGTEPHAELANCLSVYGIFHFMVDVGAESAESEPRVTGAAVPPLAAAARAVSEAAPARGAVAGASRGGDVTGWPGAGQQAGL